MEPTTILGVRNFLQDAHWTPAQAAAFGVAYREAREAGQRQFMFEGRQHLTAYAQCVLVYLNKEVEPNR